MVGWLVYWVGGWVLAGSVDEVVGPLVLLKLVIVGFGRPGHRIGSPLDRNHLRDVGRSHRLDAERQAWLAHKGAG